MRLREKGPAPLRGALEVPGDKSISHRALILASLAEGTSEVTGLNTGADVAATASCLEALGAAVAVRSSAATVVGRGLREPTSVLDAGNSGTTLRTLLGVCARTEGMSVLTGDTSLRRRPMLRVVAPLREMGAVIEARDHGNLPPVVVRGGSLSGIDKELPVASAQIKTALLLAAMGAEGTTSVTEPGPSRDHTERMIGALGAPVTVVERSCSLVGPWAPPAFELRVPGDLSSALYLIAAALLVPGSELSIEGLGLNPTRTGGLEVLRSMGANLTWTVTGESLGEPVGTVVAKHSPLTGTTISGTELIPRTIDELPLLAVVASQAEGTTVIADAAELKVKESDRIAALADGLRTLGARVEPQPDGLVIEGPSVLDGGTVDSLDDHRIALSFAVGGLVARSKVTVKGWQCTNTSFPEFLELLDQARSAR